MKIWKLKIPEKLRVHMWLSSWDSLMTNRLRAIPGLPDTDACSRCDCHAETILHPLRDCYKAQDMWAVFVKPEEEDQFFSANMRAWIDKNIKTVSR